MMTKEEIYLQEAYQEEELEVVKKSKHFKAYDAKPFIGDGWVFNDIQFENIMADLFDSKRSDLTDRYYYKAILADCKRAKPAYEQELDLMTTVSTKFKDDPASRQIFEDCSYSNGQVRIPQLTKKTCSIPSHLREENIAKFAGISFGQAKTISKIYRAIGVDFKMAIRINKVIRRRSCANPWDIKITKKGLTLLKLAQELKAVESADQEETDYQNTDFLGDSYVEMDDMASHWNVDDDPKQDELDNLYSQTNNVGEYTYWNISAIPKSDHLIGKRASIFRKLINRIERMDINNVETTDVDVIDIKRITNWVKRKGTWAQKAKFKEVMNEYYMKTAVKIQALMG